MRCFDLEAVGVHALPHIENLGLLVGLKVEPLLEERLDLCQPLAGNLLARRDDYDVIHVPSVVFRPEEADTHLIELVEEDIGKVLGADVPERDACLAFRAGVDHLAKKPIKPKEVLVEIGVLLLELLEPLRDDFLEQSAVDRIEKLPGVDLDNCSIVAPFHACYPHVVLNLEGRSYRPFTILAREGAVDKDGPEDVLQLLMDDKLHDLVSELRDVEVSLFRLCYLPIVIGPRVIFPGSGLRCFLNFLEITPQFNIVHFG